MLVDRGRADEVWVSWYRPWAAVLVAVAALVGGITTHTGGPPQAFAAMAFPSAITLWCMLDARCHGKAFLHSFGWIMFMTWPIGGLVYLVWTRRARGVLAYLGAALVVSFASALGYAFAAALAR